ncbi:hypothetical protein ACN6LM_006803 [Streptomyces sp. SAS_281]|uniref:hypothetical protein n=1 Tax=Streptomyces sp. SAS_281 TaxID=3412744 RepID=UPI00403CD31C
MTTSTPCDRCLPMVDELLTLSFPASTTTDATGHAGPDYRVRYLRTSQDFWDHDGQTHDGQTWDKAYGELEACLDDLTLILSARWGDPLSVDLWAWLTAELNGELDDEVPEPLEYLTQHATSMLAWPLPNGTHWLGLALGQADKELPLVLYAAIGTGPVRQTP